MINQVLDQACPVSQSNLWDVLKLQYTREKSDIWQKVPCGITNSLYLARQYINLINSLQTKIGKAVHVIELGAGISRLAYYMLKLDQDIHYTMVDLRPDFKEFIAAHPDWGSIPPDRYSVLEGGEEVLFTHVESLQKQKDVFCVFIAHYVLDSLPTDVWEKYDEKWYPIGLKLIGRKQSIAEADFDKLNLKFFRGDEHENSAAYTDARNASAAGCQYNYLTVPVGGFALLDRLKRTCQSALWLIADKVLMEHAGHDDMYGFRRDHAWSVCVNLRALEHYAVAQGCSVMVDSAYQSEVIHVMAVSWGVKLPEFKLHSLASYFEMVEMLGTASRIQIEHAIGFLRYGGFDPWVLRVVGNSVDADLSLNDHRRDLWLDVLRETLRWSYYHRGDNELLILADFFMRAKAYDDAEQVLQLCDERFGESVQLSILWGQWAFRQGKNDHAKAYWQHAQRLDPRSERVKRFVDLVS